MIPAVIEPDDTSRSRMEIPDQKKWFTFIRKTKINKTK